MWSLPPPNPVLSISDVHVWRVSVGQAAYHLAWLARTLSAEEQARAARFHFERDRARSIVSQGVLRLILSHYLNIAPDRLQFRTGSYGKPALAESQGGDMLRFNSSHSQGLVLYALARGREIGVDLEYIRPLPDLEPIAERFFSAGEVAALRALPPGQRVEAFFACWTRKEAYLKAIGEGLLRPLDQFQVSLTPGEPARLLHVEGDPQEPARWSLQALTPAPGYIGALAVEGDGWRLARWQWTGESR
jgi:4'-phosphopantetheinyl transferase